MGIGGMAVEYNCVFDNNNLFFLEFVEMLNYFWTNFHKT